MPLFVGNSPLVGLNHFLGGAGILTVGFIVKIAVPGGRDVKDGGQGKQQNEECMPDRRRRKHRWLDQSFFKPEDLGSCDHFRF